MSIICHLLTLKACFTNNKTTLISYQLILSVCHLFFCNHDMAHIPSCSVLDGLKIKQFWSLQSCRLALKLLQTAVYCKCKNNTRIGLII